jgi:hypothetical protein
VLPPSGDLVHRALFPLRALVVLVLIVLGLVVILGLVLVTLLGLVVLILVGVREIVVLIGLVFLFLTPGDLLEGCADGILGGLVQLPLVLVILIIGGPLRRLRRLPMLRGREAPGFREPELPGARRAGIDNHAYTCAMKSS